MEDTRSSSMNPDLLSAAVVSGHDNDFQESLTSSIIDDYDIVNGPERPMRAIQSGASRKPNSSVDASKEITVDVDGEQQGMKGSPRTPYVRICPPVNCKEKIIICLDLNEEMETTCFRSRAGDKYSSLDLARRAIKMFVMHKSQMSPHHEFAFIVFHEDATMIQDFSSNADNLLQALHDSQMVTQPSGPLDLDFLFQIIEENVRLPELSANPQVTSPPYVVRLLMVYGRSQSIPVGQGKQAQRLLESSPCFFTDVLYIHQPVSEDNSCEDIFNRLCQLDPIGLSYILEASKYTPIFNSAAKLLAHPLQRPIQDKASYKIGSLPTVPDIDDRVMAGY